MQRKAKPWYGLGRVGRVGQGREGDSGRGKRESLAGTLNATLLAGGDRSAGRGSETEVRGLRRGGGGDGSGGLAGRGKVRVRGQQDQLSYPKKEFETTRIQRRHQKNRATASPNFPQVSTNFPRFSDAFEGVAERRARSIRRQRPRSAERRSVTFRSGP